MFYKLQKTGKYTYVYLVNNKREGTKIKTSVIEKLGRYDKLNDEMRALVDRSLAETKEHKPIFPESSNSVCQNNKRHCKCG